MSKITMTFDMSSPDDRQDFKLASHGRELAIVLWTLDQELRAAYKYQDQDKIEIPVIRKKIQDLFTENGMVWEDINQ
jgi:hypothetical protein